MSGYVNKPGYMWRACVAWVVLNTILVATLAVTVWLVQPWMAAWFVSLPILVGIVASEWAITNETIAPIVSDWIKQAEYKP